MDGIKAFPTVDEVRDIARDGLVEVWAQWKRSDSVVSDSEKIRSLASRALDLGDCLLSLDVIQTASQSVQKNPQVAYLWARVLAQMGHSESARSKLLSLIESGVVSCDIISLMGRTYKDDWRTSKSQTDLDAAICWYARAFRTFRRSHPGTATFPAVNIASLYLLAGQEKASRCWANRVIELKELALGEPDQVAWQPPTLGEAFLCLGDIEAARAQYRLAGHLNLRAKSSVRKQARLLLSHLGLPIGEFDDCFRLPSVVVFAGHMLDAPGREPQRFPAELEGKVAKEIELELNRVGAGFGYCSAAAGSDLIFAEAILMRHGELHVSLSGPKDDFFERSVGYLEGGSWKERFESVLIKSTNPVDRSPDHQPRDRSLGYVYAHLKLCGLALMRAKILGLDLVPLCVYDAQSIGGEGGTADFFHFWEKYILENGKEDQESQITITPRTIDLRALRDPNWRSSATATPGELFPCRSNHTGFRTQGMEQNIKAMLFADVQNFSKLSEEQLPDFFRHYMGRISSIIDESHFSPINSETWGDAVYMVFDELEHAGRFALEMRRALASPAEWKISHGLPPNLAIRIALHAGPVFSLVDRVTRRISFTGRHVSQAARLEPITEPGEVFATESFAALACAVRSEGFGCEYVGSRQLPKDYGEVRVFRLHEKCVAS